MSRQTIVQPDWNKIAYDVAYKLPNLQYLDYVSRYLLDGHPLQENIDPFDPFGLDSLFSWSEYTVDREDVERHISSRGRQIVLGPLGRGKTTLAKRMAGDFGLASRTLIVPIFLGHRSYPIFMKKNETPPGPLNISQLTQTIMNVYWEDFILPPSNQSINQNLRQDIARQDSQTVIRQDPDWHSDSVRQSSLWMFRQDPNWIEKLHWFYQHYLPTHPFIPDDPHLVSLLQGKLSKNILNVNLSPEGILKELINFVCYTPQIIHNRWEILSLPEKPRPRYQKISILVDGTESLASDVSRQLPIDFEQLMCADLPNLEIHLFEESIREKSLVDLKCVQSGRVAVYQIPKWKPEEYRKLLALRVKVCGIGDYITPYDWPKKLPPSALDPLISFRLVDRMIECSHLPVTKENSMDETIHLLKLTRGVLAACAGCWSNDGLVPPIQNSHIQNLIDAYWQR